MFDNITLHPFSHTNNRNIIFTIRPIPAPPPFLPQKIFFIAVDLRFFGAIAISGSHPFCVRPTPQIREKS
jgi:hypothetical protein